MASPIREFSPGPPADNDRQPVVSTYYVAGTVLSSLYDSNESTHLIPIIGTNHFAGVRKLRQREVK